MVQVFSPCLAEILRIEGYDRLLFQWWWLTLPIIALMVLLACWRLTVQMLLWWQKPRSNPVGLFRQLARVHSLNQQEKVLISRMHQALPKGASGYPICRPFDMGMESNNRPHRPRWFREIVSQDIWVSS